MSLLLSTLDRSCLTRLLIAVALIATAGSLSAQPMTLVPAIVAASNIDTEELDDIDFVEDAIDDGRDFFEGPLPSRDVLTNDEDEEATRIVYAPVDLTGATSIEIDFSWATIDDGDFDGASEFSVSAAGVAGPIFQVLGRGLADRGADFFEFFDRETVDGQAILDAGISLNSVVFEVLLDPGSDGEDESIFFDNFSVTFDTAVIDDGGDEGDGAGAGDAGAAAGDGGGEATAAVGDAGGVALPVAEAAQVAAAGVPEPSACVLLAGGGLLVAGRHRRDLRQATQAAGLLTSQGSSRETVQRLL